MQDEMLQQPLTLGELLSNSESDRTILAGQLSQLYEDFFGEVLTFLELAIPSQNGEKAEKFVMVRSKILRSGNDKIRKAKDLLEDYLVKRVFENKRTVIDFRKKERV